MIKDLLIVMLQSEKRESYKPHSILFTVIYFIYTTSGENDIDIPSENLMSIVHILRDVVNMSIEADQENGFKMKSAFTYEMLFFVALG